MEVELGRLGAFKTQLFDAYRAGGLAFSERFNGFGCPSIRTKALSSNTYLARCFSHRVVARELEDKELWKSHGQSLLGETVPPTIDTV